MDPRVDELERQLRELTRKVEQLDAKVSALAAGQSPAVAAAVEPPASPVAEPAAPTEAGASFSGTASLLGRTFLVIAGAFVIRAATDRELVPRGVGVALGLAFAALWVALALRAAARQQLASATWHGVAASLVGFPLVLETGTRLALLSPTVAAVVLAAFTTALALVGVVHQKSRFVWLATAGGLVTAAGLMLNGPQSHAVPLALLFFGFATLALEDVRGWGAPRWPVALLLDGVAIRGVFWAAGNEPKPEVLGPVTGLMLATSSLYVLGTLWRSWARRRHAGGFELVQGGLALALAVASASRTQALLGWSAPVGEVLLLLAAAAVATLAVRCEGDDFRLDRWFYGLFALVAVLTGAPMALHGAIVSVGWVALALAAALVGRRALTPAMWTFAAVLGWAAALSAGLGGVALDAFFGEPSAAGGMTGELWAVAGGVVAAELALTVRGPQVERWLRGLSAALLLLAVLLGASALVLFARRALGGATADVGVLILARTLTLLAAALALALGRRAGGPPELAWISGATLVGAALKVLGQDLPAGHAGTVAVAFLCLGAMIIVFPRLVRQAGPPPAPPPPGAPPAAPAPPAA